MHSTLSKLDKRIGSCWWRRRNLCWILPYDTLTSESEDNSRDSQRLFISNWRFVEVGGGTAVRVANDSRDESVAKRQDKVEATVEIINDVDCCCS